MGRFNSNSTELWCDRHSWRASSTDGYVTYRVHKSLCASIHSTWKPSFGSTTSKKMIYFYARSMANEGKNRDLAKSNRTHAVCTESPNNRNLTTIRDASHQWSRQTTQNQIVLFLFWNIVNCANSHSSKYDWSLSKILIIVIAWWKLFSIIAIIIQFFIRCFGLFGNVDDEDEDDIDRRGTRHEDENNADDLPMVERVDIPNRIEQRKKCHTVSIWLGRQCRRHSGSSSSSRVRPMPLTVCDGGVGCRASLMRNWMQRSTSIIHCCALT